MLPFMIAMMTTLAEMLKKEDTVMLGYSYIVIQYSELFNIKQLLEVLETKFCFICHNT